MSDAPITELPPTEYTERAGATRHDAAARWWGRFPNGEVAQLHFVPIPPEVRRSRVRHKNGAKAYGITPYGRHLRARPEDVVVLVPAGEPHANHQHDLSEHTGVLPPVPPLGTQLDAS